MKLKFDGKVRISGNSYVVTIPSDYVNNGLVPKDTDLLFTVDVPDETPTITE